MIVTFEEMQIAVDCFREGIGVSGFSDAALAACADLHDQAARGFAYQGMLHQACACDDVIERINSYPPLD